MMASRSENQVRLLFGGRQLLQTCKHSLVAGGTVRPRLVGTRRSARFPRCKPLVTRCYGTRAGDFRHGAQYARVPG